MTDNREYLTDDDTRKKTDKMVKFCKIRGFHGGDYGECRLLGYKNPH
jgi:hypothetical protein